MVVFNNILAGASGAGVADSYQISKSLRFNSGDSSYLHATFSGPTSTYTFSCWVKLGALNSFEYIFTSGGSGLAFNGSSFYYYDGSSVQTTTAKFRDPSAWYHLVLSVNSLSFTLYVNGVNVKTGTASALSTSSNGSFIGKFTGNLYYFNGYLADVQLVDGQALAPTDFGELDSKNVWQAKEFTGSYTAAASGTTTSLSQVGWQTSDQANIWDGSTSTRAVGYNDNRVGTISFNPPLTNVTKVEVYTQNYNHFLNGASVSASGSGNPGWYTLYNSSSSITLYSVGNAYSSNTQTVDFYAIRINDTIVNAQTWTPPAGVGLQGTGANSFYLKFADNSSNAALGTDSSGNSNTWTVNNLSVAGPSVTTTGNINLGSSNRSFYFKGSVGDQLTVASGNFVWDSSDGNTWTYRGQSGTTVTLTSAYVEISGTTSVSFPNSSSDTVVYWSLPLGTGLPNSSGTTGTFNIDSYGEDAIDSLIDTPTNYTAASGNNGGNYATFNHLDKHSSLTISDGNLKVQASTTQWEMARSTFFLNSGKHYWEFTWTGGVTESSGYQMGLKTNESTLSAAAQQTGSYAFQYTSIYQTAGSNNTVTISPGSTTSGDTVMFAYDADAGKMWIGVNGSWNGSGNPATGANPDWTSLPTTGLSPFAGCYGSSNTIILNAGQRSFSYTPPTGYKSLCTTNLPHPTIADGSTAFDSVTYSGDGTNGRAITGINHSPDLVWIKARNQADGHNLFDIVRGTTKVIKSNNTNAELTESNSLTAFNSDGFTVGSNASNAQVNASGFTYVAWAWDAGANSSKTYTVKVVSDGGNKFRFDDFGTSAVTLDLEEGSTYVFDQSDSSNATHPLRFATAADAGGGTEYTTGVTTTGTPGQTGAKTTITVASGAPTLYYYCSSHTGMGGQANTNSTAGASNFAGSIQSSVRANPSAGFSIVEYSATGSTGSIGHQLNAVPDFILAKSRTSTGSWMTYHSAYPGGTHGFNFQASTGVYTDSGFWNGASPDSNVITLGSYTSTAHDWIAYCWSAVEGYSSFGKYTGNGSATDGPFVYTGMLVSWVLIKRSDGGSENWILWDTARNESNVMGKQLYPNTSSAEADAGTDSAYGILDCVSNGFKIRGSHSSFNVSGGEFIYLAFASQPFKTARAR